MKTNGVIRNAAKASCVPFWKIADSLGVSEPTFTRLMRKQVSPETEAKILGIIQLLSKEAV